MPWRRKPPGRPPRYYAGSSLVNTELLIPLLTFGGTLLLVLTGLLNFSVFVRQLRAAREQLETARRQVESARQQPEIQLVQRAMSETSDHLRILSRGRTCALTSTRTGLGPRVTRRATTR